MLYFSANYMRIIYAWGMKAQGRIATIAEKSSGCIFHVVDTQSRFYRDEINLFADLELAILIVLQLLQCRPQKASLVHPRFTGFIK